jgi:ferredoxin
MSSVYEELRKKLDDMATGYPKTESKIEIKILKQLFNENQAELFLALTPIPEKLEDIALRLERDVDELGKKLEEMAQKGLIFRKRKEDSVSYSAVPFVVGIFEYQVKQLNKEVACDIKQYFDEKLGKTIMGHKHPVMRAIPVNKQLVTEWPIAPYDDVEKIFDKEDKIAILNCICRTWGRFTENGCNKPLETCFYFGSHADYFVENQIGRYVEAEEAKKIIKETLSKTGLVLQLGSGQQPGAVCMCCGDCCNMLLSLKMQPNPAEAAKSNYQIRVDSEKCEGCEDCIERCQMDAIQVSTDVAQIDYDRCIGCGACTFGCSNGALSLIRKPEEELYTPPANIFETYMDIMVERGKL